MCGLFRGEDRVDDRSASAIRELDDASPIACEDGTEPCSHICARDDPTNLDESHPRLNRYNFSSLAHGKTQSPFIACVGILLPKPTRTIVGLGPFAIAAFTASYAGRFKPPAFSNAPSRFGGVLGDLTFPRSKNLASPSNSSQNTAQLPSPSWKPPRCSPKKLPKRRCKNRRRLSRPLRLSKLNRYPSRPLKPQRLKRSSMFNRSRRRSRVWTTRTPSKFPGFRINSTPRLRCRSGRPCQEPLQPRCRPCHPPRSAIQNRPRKTRPTKSRPALSRHRLRSLW